MQTGRPTKRKRTEFGERLAQAREQAGLSQQQLADKLNTTQRAVSWWEREPVALRADQLSALAQALGVTTDYLLGKQPMKARGSGPVGKARRLFDAVSKLPRHQQEKVFAILEPFVERQSKPA